MSALTLLAMLCFCSIGLAMGAQVVDEVVEQGKKVLSSGREGGKTIRQCSCPEQTACVEQMKQQAIQCFHSCWDNQDLAAVTSNPQQLKTCFEKKEYIIDHFLGCLGDDGNTCTADKNGPQVQYTDINKVINVGGKKLNSQAKTFMKSLNQDGHDLLNTAISTGTCIKDCFLKENANGYCFDKSNCQPKIEENSAKAVVKKCAREVGWKKEAGDLCDCATRAGVDKVKQYCQLLHTIDHGRAGRRS